jgi:hypothetical protein
VGIPGTSWAEGPGLLRENKISSPLSCITASGQNPALSNGCFVVSQRVSKFVDARSGRRPCTSRRSPIRRGEVRSTKLNLGSRALVQSASHSNKHQLTCHGVIAGPPGAQAIRKTFVFVCLCFLLSV